MPKFDQVGISQRAQLDTPQRSVQTEVVASPVNIAVTPAENNMMRLAGALKLATPVVEQYAQDQAQEGRVARANGQENPNDLFGLQAKGWMEMDSTVHADQDWLQLKADYMTKFDKENSTPADLDKFISDRVNGHLQGMPSQHYRDNYSELLAKNAVQLRQDFTAYTIGRMVEKTEANVVQLNYNMVKDSLANGKLPSVEDFKGVTQFAKEHGINISESRSDQLMFEAVKRFAEEGHPDILSVFKADTKDPTDPTKTQPGMYFKPGWKDKIDQLEITASHNFVTRKNAEYAYAENLRKHEIDASMGDVMEKMALGDVGGAQALYEEKVRSGLFHGQGGQLVTWMGNMAKTAKETETPAQQLRMTDTLIKVYEGKASYEDILKSGCTPTQITSMAKELRAVRHENRSAAAAERANAIADFTPAITKSIEYTSGKDFITDFLKTKGVGAFDPFGAVRNWTDQQRAVAQLEFTRRALNEKDPMKLRGIVHDVATKYRQAIAEREATMIGTAPGWLQYSNEEELRAASSRGEVDLETVNHHLAYFDEMNKPKPK
ncbi:MAG TPA: hypothetical protein DE312_07590 [Gallionella sp.]|nr:MAG: hypothetical protein A2Z87_00395 [Gallionellales bacterium GWA2_54_124]OGT18463.1 MAG: hypothetical protein A2522_04590 [Gallionellales bacterium RIFOXYD12_FULL_53_10]HCI53157.1 hypothetical protein [Gallionella sp.]